MFSRVPNVRRATDRLLKLVEDGVLDRDQVILACVKYMSEYEVADMCHHNEFFEDDEDEDDEDDELARILRGPYGGGL